jgi:hypothetical protein
MGADKNSSPKRELGLYPKFTTKDPHTSLPRSRSHYGPTNPRNKPETILKRKHESRSKRLSNPAQCRADGPRAWGGQSADTGRTVRYPRADGPFIATERPDVHSNTRTVRTSSTDGPRATGTMRTVRDVQAYGPPNTYQPKTAGQPDRNKSAQEHATNTKNPRPTGSTQMVRTYQADYPPGVNRRGNTSPRANPRAPYHLSFHGSHKRLELLRKGLGKM